MPALTDARFDALRVLVPLAPPTTNDMIFAWLVTEGGSGDSVGDRWNSMLLSKNAVSVQGQRNDMWRAVLADNGFAQPQLNDAQLAYWVAGGPALS